MPRRFPALVFATFLTGVALRAQTIELTQGGTFNQTGKTSTSNVIYAEVTATVTGPSAGSLSAPTFKVPSGSLLNTTETLTYGNGEWSFDSSHYSGGIASSSGAFGSGNYNFTIGSTTATSLGFRSGIASDLPNTPYAIMSTGTWSAGNTVYTLSSAQAANLSISSSVFGTNYQSGSALIVMALKDTTSGSLVASSDTSGSGYSATQGTLNLTNLLTAGHSYEVSVEFESIVNATGYATPDTSTFAGYTAFSALTRTTNFDFTVSAVPEPATYGLCAGVAVLAGVLVRRRRQAV